MNDQVSKFFKKGKDLLSVILVCIFLGSIIGFMVAYELVNSRIEESILTGRFLYKKSVYDISLNEEKTIGIPKDMKLEK